MCVVCVGQSYVTAQKHLVIVGVKGVDDAQNRRAEVEAMKMRFKSWGSDKVMEVRKVLHLHDAYLVLGVHSNIPKRAESFGIHTGTHCT